MFVTAPDMSCLRQGDILDGVPFPRLSSTDVCILGRPTGSVTQPSAPALLPVTNTHRDDPQWLLAQLPLRISYCAVISQCCDLEPRNNQILPTFALARLIPVPKQIAADTQKLASLKKNKDPRVGSDPGYINFFYVDPRAELDNKDWVVDFNQVICLPGKEFPGILRNKKLQMEDDTRMKFKIKLATCFARSTEEERTKGIENPWVATQTDINFPKP